MGEIRIIGPGKTRRYPYLVCKKEFTSAAKKKKKEKINSVSLIGREFISRRKFFQELILYRRKDTEEKIKKERKW